MPQPFNTSLIPFDRLDVSQQSRLVNALDVAYFRAGEVIIQVGASCQSLYIILKGSVEETSADQQEHYAHYTTDDLFDVRAQLSGHSRHQYRAVEDTLCYLLPQPIFAEFYQQNPDFAAYFDTNLATRQQLLEQAHRQPNLAEFILTRIRPDNIQPCLKLSAETDLHTATARMQQQNCDAAVIALPDNAPHRFGIITRTDLLHAVMLDGKASSTPVSQIATTPVIRIELGDYLFNAMIAMTRHRVKRVLITQDEDIAGMLDMTQVLSLFSTHSHVLALRIARATSIEELALASESQPALVQTLFNNGIHTRFIMALIASINEQIIEKAFQLVVPAERQEQCCLLVLGSEGRGEQILKTDQDNALILADGVDWPDCHTVMSTLSDTLCKLGYPTCPGKVMVSHPDWVHSVSGWQHRIRQCCEQGDENAMMTLAILADAQAVAGNRNLLEPVTQTLHQRLASQELLLSTFARPAMKFSVPLTLFGQIKRSKHGPDIKRGGIFPIVHGIRTLALEYDVAETNTFNRLTALEQRKVLEPTTASNLSEALKLFIRLRLRQQLSLNDESQSAGQQHQLDLAVLSRAERDVLRHSLHVVKKFKEWLSYHYQLRD
ncbi:DUF294 nucleotidyltransferase-like domain-containing protein [Photobacterium galatheae]|uniref:Cyclic nucleotide-binding protein n=1 Tax=Photobacterium galatheae TaxID=1654360 RepID=A0A066RNC4_9GAMM|nr:DUF294 nucleotidyltransferase-like domain-containing protein [Photobacterium galatheae]KDM91965.1 cyclic nucleotide-binding protein [Photobacterium galatheae]MCM0151302.1 cyclic nucleotide-binding/CBS domain-containing protein [Photobacterium galatheae]